MMSDLYASESGSAYLSLSKKAAIYLRTAQTGSDQMAKQAESVSVYAKRHGIEIVATYEDSGKGGLTTDGRDGLRRLMQDVSSAHTSFSILLMQDISRWGRFQDIDEGAHYEYICRKAGIKIIYVEEQKEGWNTASLAIIKSLKRTMAGEYSRALSDKIFARQCSLVMEGYWQGGRPGFGLRRMLVNEQGEIKGELSPGVHKKRNLDHVILVPGPEEEIKIVQWIYRIFIEEGVDENGIAALLNQRGIITDLNRAWSGRVVYGILTNEKYIGNNVFNRTSSKLKESRALNISDHWVRAEGVFKAIIEPAIFYQVKEIINKRCQKSTATNDL